MGVLISEEDEESSGKGLDMIFFDPMLKCPMFTLNLLFLGYLSWFMKETDSSISPEMPVCNSY